ncbi:MAG: hypothetical protein K6T94_25790 [Paenibacillus sp.]|nr:hypothetical protein [Paenibacillus sp.]
MNRPDRWSRKIGISIKILLCLILFAVILITGLLAVDSSFNILIGRQQQVSIFSFEEKSEGRYDINVLGKKQEIELDSIRLKLEEYGRTLISWGEDIKDNLVHLVEMAKKYVRVINLIRLVV